MSYQDLHALTAKHVREVIDATSKQVTSMFPAGPGKRKRSPQELASLFRAIANEPSESRQAIMESIAKQAGHAPGEERPCELCRFLGDQAMRFAKDTGLA
jgi:hypothetical protein